MKKTEKPIPSKLVRLNKWISDSGYCSRRKADQLIASKRVQVNQETVQKLATLVSMEDKVSVDGRFLPPRKPRRILLLNKPVEVITTTHDPQGRETVISYLKKKLRQELSGLKKNSSGRGSTIKLWEELLLNLATYIPIGRLDRNTSGVLLLTNDKAISHQLTHPSQAIKKIYQITTRFKLPQTVLEKAQNGLNLEDGFFRPDQIKRVEENHRVKTDHQLVITVHSGRNRILRRYFRELGHPIKRLERISFHGCHTGGLSRGQFRLLDLREQTRLLAHSV